MIDTSREINVIVDDVMKPVQWTHHDPSDWQYYVGPHTQRVWDSLSLHQKIAVAFDALERQRTES